jgi:hypothetical protein
MDNLYSIVKTIKHLELKQIIVPMDVKVSAQRAMKQAGGYTGIRATYWAAVYDAVFDFLNSKAQVGTYSRQMSTATSKAYIESADTAFEDGGGTLPLDEDTAAFARGELDAQFGYIDSLFQTLKELRKEGGFDAISEAFRTASRWASSLDGFYNSMKLKGAGNKMLTWRLGNTEKHCPTCLSLDGGRHRASWYFSHGYTPKKPGSNTDCGGYNCDCGTFDDEGNEFSIGNGFVI